MIGQLLGNATQAPSAVTFIDEMPVFGAELALVDRDGSHISYDAFLNRVDRLGEQFGETRRLVFVEAANTVDAIAAYIACLRGRHPVCLFNGRDRQKYQPLLERYQPNVVVGAGQDGARFDWRHRRTLDLHPSLGVLLSTSGSTGSPKLVKLSQRNIDSNARAIGKYLSLSPTERAMSSLPFSYSYGMSIINSHFASGGAIVLTGESVIDPGFWRTFQRSGATSFAGVPFTFESLERTRFSFEDLSTLRYATQAGGRLDPSLVSYFSGLASKQGWRFVVMYGQTEAAPRMAYLPAEQARSHPNCIGLAIPGGSIALLDEDGREIHDRDTPGELAYSGPNVMMGYAQSAEDLATDQTPARLHTGDVACRNAAGLIYLVGRMTRFVKPFGLRVNLDDLERIVQADLPGARCAGDDNRIFLAVSPGQHVEGVAAAGRAARATGVPDCVFRVIEVPEIPRLSSGKVDYEGILNLGWESDARASSRPTGVIAALRIVFNAKFVRRYTREVIDLIGLPPRTWKGVAHIYETHLSKADIEDSDTFLTLAGDSLSYVQVASALTEYMGALPADWPERSIRDLELVRRMRDDATL